MTREWAVKVLALEGAALGAAMFFCRLAIRNRISQKTAIYSGYIAGGGVGWSMPTKPSNPNDQGVGDEVYFETNDEMGFDDFNGEMIRIERAGATLVIKSIVSYLTFVDLGPYAALFPFETKFGLRWPKWPPELEGFVASGRVYMSGQNPGDWWEVDRTDSIPVTTDRTQGDGLTISFPTGKAGVSDLNAENRKRLDDFVASWARRF